MNRVTSRRWAMLSAALLPLITIFAMAWADPPGDFDGDGIPDEPEALPEGEAEGVAVYSGSNGSVLQVFGSPYPNGLFGFANAIIADINGNGTPDLLATAPLVPLDDSRGLAYLMAGNSGQIVRVLVGPPGETFGVAVAQAEDWDGDGRPDVRVASRFADEHGDLYDRDHIFSPYNGSKLHEQDREDARLVAIAEDLDRDGIVDADDVTLVNNAIGQTGSALALEADLTGDGVVNADDVAMVVARLGETSEAALWAPLPTGTTSGDLAKANELKWGWLTNRSARLSRINPGTGSGSSGGTGGDPGGGTGTGPGTGGSSGCCDQCKVTVSGPLGPVCLPTEQHCFDVTFSMSQSCCSTEDPKYKWSVSGGEIVGGDDDNPTVVVRICQGGSVVVSGSFGSLSEPACSSGDIKVLEVIEADLDADSDNNGPGQLPARDLTEEGIEDIGGDDGKPGKVVLVNSLDNDRDGIPDYADGYDLKPHVEADDYGGEFGFVPIAVGASNLDRTKARIRITYQASAPMDVGSTLSNPYLLPPGGHIRIWRHNGQGPRSGLPVADGGDYIAPGVYAPKDILLAYDSSISAYLLFVEAVTFSEATGDITIKIEADPDGPGGPEGWMCTDQVRITAVAIQLLGRGLDDVVYQEWETLLAPELSEYSASNPYVPGQDPHVRTVYAVRVFDPRNLAGQQLKLNNQPLVLQAGGPKIWVTPDFTCGVVSNPALPSGASPVILLTPGSTASTQGRYNPSWEFPSARIEEPPACSKEMAVLLQSISDQLRLDGWEGVDDGEYGTLVHSMASQELRNSDGWYVDMYVRNGTNEILSIDQLPPGGVANTTQVDAAWLEPGYRPQVGDTFDGSRAWVYEIKNSARGVRDLNQMNRLRAVAGPRRVLVVGPEWLWKKSTKWIKNRKYAAMRFGLGAIGIVGTVWAICYPEDLDPIIERLAVAAIRFRDATTTVNKDLAYQDLTDAARDFCVALFPDSDNVKAASMLLMEQAVAKHMAGF